MGDRVAHGDGNYQSVWRKRRGDHGPSIETVNGMNLGDLYKRLVFFVLPRYGSSLKIE